MWIAEKGGADANHFGGRLRTWRRHNNLKQAALAQMLGVSQAAVARWERGLDMPGPERFARLRTLMSGAMRDEFALERLFVSRQSAIRALYDVDGVRLVATSAGFRHFWPDFSAFQDLPMADHMIGESRAMLRDGALGYHIRNGTLGLISGVSDRHTDMQVDTAVRHRWHVCFRRHGARTLADMVYEACDPGLALGITDIVHLDQDGENWISSDSPA